MNTIRLHRVFLLTAALLACVLAPVAADGLSWDAVKSKMLTSEGYKLNYVYEGPEGRFSFRYTIRGACKEILTEVLEGSARGGGTRIYFNPEKDKENVFLATRFLTLRRSLGARDIKGSSLYQSLFAQIVSELPGQIPAGVNRAKDKIIFEFGDANGALAKLVVDAQGNPLAYRRIENGKEVKSMVFNGLRWGAHSIDWES